MRNTLVVLLLGLAPALAKKPGPPPADPHPLAGTYERTTVVCFIGCVHTETTWTIDAFGRLTGTEVHSGHDPFRGRGKFHVRESFTGVVDRDGRLTGTVTVKEKGDSRTFAYNASLSLDGNGDLVVLPDEFSPFTLFRAD